MGLSLDPGAYGRIGAGQIRQPLAQRPRVHHGPTHHQGQAAAPGDVGNGGGGVAQEIGGGIGVGGVAQVDQVMGNLRTLCGAGLGRANIESAVDLRGIDGDDLQVQLARQIQGKGALAAGRGAQQQHGAAHRPRRNRRSRSA